MSLKRKDNRPLPTRISHSPTTDAITPFHRANVQLTGNSPHFKPNTFTEGKTYLTSIEHYSLSHKGRSKAISLPKLKPNKQTFIPCKRHPQEGIIYVDVNPGVFEGLCDSCMVRSEFFGKNMKLERLNDLYAQKRRELVRAQEELSALEQKIINLYKDIVKTNVMAQPIIKEIEEMEKNVIKEVEKSFRKLKSKFLKYNPFKETRDTLKRKLEEMQETLEELEAGTYDSFEVLKSLRENKVLPETQNICRDLKARIEMDKLINPLEERDFNVVANGYDRFFEKILDACHQFASLAKTKI